MLAVSAQFALQAPVNARLAVTTGRVPAALVSFLVGIVGLAVAVLVSGGAGGFADIGEAEAWQFTGGIIGAAFVLTALAAVPVVGAGGVAAATITGQMVGSIILDARGWLGLDVEPVSALRIGGAVLLLAGTALILRRRDRDAEGGTGHRLAAGLIVLAGLALAAQARINAGLGDAIGGLEAALVNFAVGSVVLAVAVVAVRGLPGVGAARRVPRRYLLGGLIGA